MSVKPAHILGMNSRYHYTKMNPVAARAYGFSKLKTKQLLKENNLPSANVYHVFDSFSDLEHITWENIPVPFVIKPSSGSAGKGVLVIQKYLTQQNKWLDSQKNKLSEEDLSLHVRNILEGEYSTWGTQHRAIVEEMIVAHQTLSKLAVHGTPDIRVVVFNSVPIMAMARIPTKESDGRANLDQGAIALGIDIASGITTHALHGKKKSITHFPNSKKKTRGILIPFWKETLLMAVKAAQAAGYVYMGADLFIHETKGPMIVELNGFPGLSIQLANKAGLKRRIERVEGIDVRNADHGVRIAQALFAEHLISQDNVEKELLIISSQPTVTILGDNHKQTQQRALVNTVRYRSAISRKLASELDLLDYDDLLWQQQELLEGKVPVVEVTFEIKGLKIKTAMLAVNRLDKTKHKIELGRHDLDRFLVGKTES